MEGLIVFAVLIVGFWIYRKSKVEKYPDRLFEIETALETKSDLWRYKAKDEYEAERLSQHAKDLKFCQFMVNDSDAFVKENWGSVRPGLLHLTGEDMLSKIDLYYSDRADDYRSALGNLIDKLDKKAGYLEK